MAVVAVVVVEDSEVEAVLLQEGEEVSEEEVLQEVVEDFPHEVVVEASEAEEEVVVDLLQIKWM